VADFYLPHHPAVLRALSRIVHSVLEHGRDISICGDMAHQSEYIPFLLGIGVRAFSVDPIYLLRTQQVITTTSLGYAQSLARSVLAQSRVKDIEALLNTQTWACTAEQ